MIKTLHIKGLFWLAVATWGLVLVASGQPVSMALMKPSGYAVGVVTFAVTAFEKWLWRWRIFQGWLIARPDLIGTYSGTIVSAWVNPETGQSPAPIEAYVSIHQTLSSLTVRLYTAESASVSLASSLEESSDEHWSLIFTYRNEPKITLQERSRIHHGGARLGLDGPGCFRLSGHYWTDRNAFGEMAFERKSRTRSKSFEEAKSVVGDGF